MSKASLYRRRVNPVTERERCAKVVDEFAEAQIRVQAGAQNMQNKITFGYAARMLQIAAAKIRNLNDPA